MKLIDVFGRLCYAFESGSKCEKAGTASLFDFAVEFLNFVCVLAMSRLDAIGYAFFAGGRHASRLFVFLFERASKTVKFCVSFLSFFAFFFCRQISYDSWFWIFFGRFQTLQIFCFQFSNFFFDCLFFFKLKLFGCFRFLATCCERGKGRDNRDGGKEFEFVHVDKYTFFSRLCQMIFLFSSISFAVEYCGDAVRNFQQFCENQGGEMVVDSVSGDCKDVSCVGYNPNSGFCRKTQSDANEVLEYVHFVTCFSDYGGTSFIGTTGVVGGWYCVINSVCSNCDHVIAGSAEQARLYCCQNGKEPGNPGSRCAQPQPLIGIGMTYGYLVGPNDSWCGGPAGSGSNVCGVEKGDMCVSAGDVGTAEFNACMCGEGESEYCEDDGGSSGSGVSSSSGGGSSGSQGMSSGIGSSSGSMLGQSSPGGLPSSGCYHGQEIFLLSSGFMATNHQCIYHINLEVGEHFIYANRPPNTDCTIIAIDSDFHFADRDHNSCFHYFWVVCGTCDDPSSSSSSASYSSNSSKDYWCDLHPDDEVCKVAGYDEYCDSPEHYDEAYCAWSRDCSRNPHMEGCVNPQPPGGGNSGGSSGSGGVPGGGGSGGGSAGSGGGDDDGGEGSISCKSLSNCDWAKLTEQMKQLGVEQASLDSLSALVGIARAGYAMDNEAYREIESLIRLVAYYVEYYSVAQSRRDSSLRSGVSDFHEGVEHALGDVWGELHSFRLSSESMSADDRAFLGGFYSMVSGMLGGLTGAVSGSVSHNTAVLGGKLDELLRSHSDYLGWLAHSRREDSLLDALRWDRASDGLSGISDGLSGISDGVGNANRLLSRLDSTLSSGNSDIMKALEGLSGSLDTLSGSCTGTQCGDYEGVGDGAFAGLDTAKLRKARYDSLLSVGGVGALNDSANAFSSRLRAATATPFVDGMACPAAELSFDACTPFERSCVFSLCNDIFEIKGKHIFEWVGVVFEFVAWVLFFVRIA